MATATKKKKTPKITKALQPFGGGEWTPPADFTRDVQVSHHRTFRVAVSFGLGKITSKVKVCGRIVRKGGKPVTIEIAVPTTTITCKIGSGQLQARSCCKPPDTFCKRQGIHLAVKRLFVADKMGNLSSDVRRSIMEDLCPWLFSK